jgi:nucleotide-binding universal stress UspA family protein
MFERVVCGVEGSPESLVAVHQAVRLVDPMGQLVLAAVAEASLALHAGWAATPVYDQILAEARTAVQVAHAAAPNAEDFFLEGSPGKSLLDTARTEAADLLAVGTHGTPRPIGILLGSVATMMVHEAPCSVLVAREPADQHSFPRRICVGVDGSACSAQAATVARILRERFGAALTFIGGCGGKKLDLQAVRTVAPDAQIDHRPAVEALIVRAEEADADLIVVGSRGLHGAAALGSVSEWVAHQAACSVLVVRDAEVERWRASSG